VLLLLLPSPHAGLLPTGRPRYLGKVDKEEADHSRVTTTRMDYIEDEFPWSSEMLLKVVKGLFVSTGGPVGGDELESLLRWPSNSSENRAGLKKEKGWRHFQNGESGMYI
jgi:hypothetical protein